MMIHGTNDPAVPFRQSELLAAALKKAGVDALLVPVTAVTGGGHGNFGAPEVSKRLKDFFDKHLLQRAISVFVEPITAGALAATVDNK